MQDTPAQDPAPTEELSSGGGPGGALHALVAMARHFGIDTSVEHLRRRFVLPPGEPGTVDLIAIASELGLQARSVSVTFGELPKLAKTLPAILRGKEGGALLLV